VAFSQRYRTDLGVIPDIISVFQKQFPMVKVQLMNDTYSSIEKAILAGQIDCGFISQAAQNDLSFTPLYTDPLIAVIPKNHPLSRKKHVPLTALLDEPFILPCIGANYDIDNLLRSGSAVHNIRFAPNDDFCGHRHGGTRSWNQHHAGN
jgi:DNA-binding transcriptional LysR family regulator